MKGGSKKKSKNSDSEEEDFEGDAAIEEDAHLDKSNILPAGRRTRGKKVDYTVQFQNDAAAEGSDDE